MTASGIANYVDLVLNNAKRHGESFGWLGRRRRELTLGS